MIVLISCDPASLARDARLLDGHGYRLDHVTVVDLFGHTSHVETVSRFALDPDAPITATPAALAAALDRPRPRRRHWRGGTGGGGGGTR